MQEFPSVAGLRSSGPEGDPDAAGMFRSLPAPAGGHGQSQFHGVRCDGPGGRANVRDGHRHRHRSGGLFASSRHSEALGFDQETYAIFASIYTVSQQLLDRYHWGTKIVFYDSENHIGSSRLAPVFELSPL